MISNPNAATLLRETSVPLKFSPLTVVSYSISSLFVNHAGRNTV